MREDSDPPKPAAGTPPASNTPAASSIHFYWPCLFDIPLKDHYAVIIDGKKVGEIAACEHRRFTVSAGVHSVDLKSPYLFVDVAKMVGIEDAKYKVSGPIFFHLYFIQYLNWEQVSADVARRDIAGM